MFIKRLTNACFAWPTTKDQVAVSLTKAELSLLLEGMD
ncbi:transposase [Mesorhizobium sp. M1300]